MVQIYQKGKFADIIFAGFILGFLTLTKIIFGYVLLIGIVFFIVLLLFKKYRGSAVKSVYILAVALLTTMPYLIYTYQLTGKFFYWGNSGGMSLYWMSSPYQYEYGDWQLPELHSFVNQAYPSAEGDSILKANHIDEMTGILKYTGVEQDEMFKRAALKNIKSHPKKYLRNCFYNVSRMLFNFPYSYTYQNPPTIYNILLGSLMLWGCILCMVPTVLNWGKIIYPLKFMLLIVFIYMALTMLVSAYSRQFDVIAPVIIFWIAFIAERTIIIKLKITDGSPGN